MLTAAMTKGFKRRNENDERREERGERRMFGKPLIYRACTLLARKIIALI
jgi:hypothetical protein